MVSRGNYLPFHDQTAEEEVKMKTGEAVHSFSNLEYSKIPEERYQIDC